MLPLTEGSLHLRADDEDSLTSEDSFFSATEVMQGGGQVQKGGRSEGQASVRPSWRALGRGKVEPFPPTGAEFGGHQGPLLRDFIPYPGLNSEA